MDKKLSRRDFGRSLIAAGAALALPKLPVLAKPAPVQSPLVPPMFFAPISKPQDWRVPSDWQSMQYEIRRKLGNTSYARRCLLVDEVPQGCGMRYKPQHWFAGNQQVSPIEIQAKLMSMRRSAVTWQAAMEARPFWDAYTLNNRPFATDGQFGDLTICHETPDGPYVIYHQLKGPDVKLDEIQHETGLIDDGPDVVDRIVAAMRAVEERTFNTMLLSLNPLTFSHGGLSNSVEAMYEMRWENSHEFSRAFRHIEYDTVFGGAVNRIIAHESMRDVLKAVGMDHDEWLWTAQVYFTEDPRLENTAYLLPLPDELGVLSVRTNATAIPMKGYGLPSPDGEKWGAFAGYGWGILNPMLVVRVRK